MSRKAYQVPPLSVRLSPEVLQWLEYESIRLTTKTGKHVYKSDLIKLAVRAFIKASEDIPC